MLQQVKSLPEHTADAYSACCDNANRATKPAATFKLPDTEFALIVVCVARVCFSRVLLFYRWVCLSAVPAG